MEEAQRWVYDSLRKILYGLMETIKVTIELPINMVTDFMDFVSAFKNYKTTATAKTIEEEKENIVSPIDEVSQPTDNRESIAEPTDSRDGLAEPTDSRSGKPKDIEEVRRYVLDNNLNVSVDKFYRYYDERHWKDGKGEEIQDWKAIIEGWHKREWRMGKQQQQVRRMNNQLQHHEPTGWTPEDDLRRLSEKLEREGHI